MFTIFKTDLNLCTPLELAALYYFLNSSKFEIPSNGEFAQVVLNTLNNLIGVNDATNLIDKFAAISE